MAEKDKKAAAAEIPQPGDTPAPEPAKKPAGPVPTLGRIVHFGVKGKDTRYAAVVTRAHDASTVNLRIFDDAVDPCGKKSVTNVPLFDGKLDQDLFWVWPPRV